jgi:hypothetical protein
MSLSACWSILATDGPSPAKSDGEQTSQYCSWWDRSDNSGSPPSLGEGLGERALGDAICPHPLTPSPTRRGGTMSHPMWCRAAFLALPLAPLPFRGRRASPRLEFYRVFGPIHSVALDARDFPQKGRIWLEDGIFLVVPGKVDDYLDKRVLRFVMRMRRQAMLENAGSGPE